MLRGSGTIGLDLGNIGLELWGFLGGNPKAIAVVLRGTTWSSNSGPFLPSEPPLCPFALVLGSSLTLIGRSWGARSREGQSFCPGTVTLSAKLALSDQYTHLPGSSLWGPGP